MLDDLAELRTFVRIIGAGSLSGAAREMNLALSVVSKRLAALERRTDTRLINRSTRRLAPTEEGQRLYDRALRILAEVDEAEEMLARGQAEPQGTLRISAPVALGRRYIAPLCQDLVRSYPKIAVDLALGDRLVGLIDEGVDVVVRIGAPLDSNLVMRKIVDNHRVVVASPGYLEANGVPATPDELGRHECLRYGGVGSNWRLVGPAGWVAEVQTSARLICDSGDVAQDWALAGGGLIMKSWVDVAEDVRLGRLVRVLPAWKSEPAPVCALFPPGRTLSNRVRLFIDAVTARLRSLPQPASGSDDMDARSDVASPS